MERKRLNEIAWGITLGALACICLMTASSAWAAAGSGSAALKLAQHDKGRTLSGQGGKIVVDKLPITELDLAKATAATSGNLSFRKGSREVTLTGIHFDFAAGTLNGLLAGQQAAVF
ncbi:MAG TPA: hypothetical protein VGK41_04470, partial [Solirubrobacterales bacterium]